MARDGTLPIASYMAQSTRAPAPDAPARRHAANAPSAAVCPVMDSAVMPGSLTGASSSEYPCGNVDQAAAWPVRSVHLYPA